MSMLEALAIASGTAAGRRSPVAAAKALHLLAPAFFPLWDERIAKAYGCNYSADPVDAYLRFMQITRCVLIEHATTLAGMQDGKSQLKVLGEYNYARFTKNWAYGGLVPAMASSSPSRNAGP